MQLRTLFPVLGPALRNRQGYLGRIGAIGLIGCASWLLVGNAEPQTSTVTVTATNLRSAEGVVRACMTNKAKGFPKACRGDASAYTKVVNAAGSVTFTFDNVKPGRYAIALLHDENNNGKADRALMMMPTEGFGFSRDAKVRMGPPKFSSAAFDVTSQDQSQTIKMRYML